MRAWLERSFRNRIFLTVLLVALVPLLLFAALLEGILRRGRPGEGIGEITLRALGPVAGRAALCLYALWFLLYGAFALRIGAERFIEAVFPLSQPWPFVGTILTMAVCGALGEPKALFRAAEIFWPLLAGVLTLVLVFALPGLDVKNLLPVTAADAPGVARSALTVFGAGALLLAQNAFDTDALQTNVVPRLNLALLGLGTVGTYLTGRARKTI